MSNRWAQRGVQDYSFLRRDPEADKRAKRISDLMNMGGVAAQGIGMGAGAAIGAGLGGPAGMKMGADLGGSLGGLAGAPMKMGAESALDPQRKRDLDTMALLQAMQSMR